MVSFGNIDSSNVVPETHEYTVPIRAVLKMEDMAVWEKSEAYYEYLGFISAMNEAIKGKTLQIDCLQTDVISGLLQLLNKVDDWIAEIPPLEQPQRFGNKAFKIWYTRLKENCPELLQEALPTKFHRAISEIKEYLIESFGNSTRIDYGTGHEMSFCMFLCCLFKIGAFLITDQVAVVCKVFNRYLHLVRKLQVIYKMEPAGTRGVWSLDDYQFVPFIWGSSQLIGINFFV
uniref:Serine/threonine-protein phosphatase 2A activator n=1 Tax=Clastoptera arizonana TaxID=38151 RepID=A0A1B6C8Y1_9HEMI